MVEGLEMTCFQIISNVGAARSSYIEGIQKAKAGDFEGARNCIEEGQKQMCIRDRLQAGDWAPQAQAP